MKAIVIVLLAAFALSASGKKIRYDGYAVKRITPQTEEQLAALRKLESLGVSFWHEPSYVGRHADVMFPPHLQGDLLDGMSTMGMSVQTFIEDVQELIDGEQGSDKAGTNAFNFAAYHDVDDINAFLVETQRAHPSKTELFSIGKSYEGRDLNVLKISTGSGRKAIWLDANIHAREWITSAVTLFTIQELLNGTRQGWTEDFDWYILTVFNPDGLHYTHTTDRLWRKTRSTPTNPLGCKGADANRNFGFHWMEGGASNNSCTETYGGKSAFSEVETQAVRDFITVINKELVSYISLHSYSQYILLPFGHNNKKIPQYNHYMDLGRRIATATAQRYGTQFVPGNIVDLLYVASGGSMDWVKGTYNTNLTLTYEMRDNGRYGFILPANQIVPSSEEFLDGLAVAIAELRAGIPTPDFPEIPRVLPKRTHHRVVPSILNQEEHHTFGNVPHPRRAMPPLASFRRH